MTDKNKTKKGLLLINLGTPDSPQVSDVRAYLKEFLMDKFVLSIPALFRWIVVNGFILPFRPEKSAHAYSKIWTKRGSPLKFHTIDLTEQVKTMLASAEIKTTYGMRYGNPSIESSLNEFKAEGIEDIYCVPLYPHYALSSFETAIEKVTQTNKKKFSNKLNITFAKPFFNEPYFMDALCLHVKAKLQEIGSWDHLLFSYHGLPESHVKKTSAPNYCFSTPHCCDELNESNKNCYRAQSFATTRLVIDKLNLDSSKCSSSFQSRLGPTPWIQPFTDTVLEKLAKEKKVKKLVVLCPSFVADCLETLEEIQIRAKEDFKNFGGEDLILIPCLNSDETWAKNLATHAKEQIYKSTI